MSIEVHRNPILRSAVDEGRHCKDGKKGILVRKAAARAHKSDGKERPSPSWNSRTSPYWQALVHVPCEEHHSHKVQRAGWVGNYSRFETRLLRLLLLLPGRSLKKRRGPCAPTTQLRRQPLHKRVFDFSKRHRELKVELSAKVDDEGHHTTDHQLAEESDGEFKEPVPGRRRSTNDRAPLCSTSSAAVGGLVVRQRAP